MDDKVIVTNLTALKSKYGAAGIKKIQTAITKLVAADKKRKIDTRLVALDDAKTMKSLAAPLVTNATDPKQNKAAIDGVYQKLMPDFLMILGSIDVVPHQDLTNPMADDGDPFAYGDLPYACEAPYSQQPGDFRGPTRVVGRLPDLTGGGDPSYLIRLIETAAKAKPASAEKYASYFGISAEVWKESTRESLEKLFGSGTDLRLTPDGGPEWDHDFISRLAHFINCHGVDTRSQFYGQRGQQYPISHDAFYIGGKIKEGTVAAVECCYGAQLYNPSQEDDGRHSICNTYLENGAYGFFGSTTVAYGPAAGNSSADLLCQFFLKRVLGGASTGRAALEARQEFVEATPVIDPVDLKTIAQFNLYGDPSIMPVAAKKQQVGVAKAAKGLLSQDALLDAAAVDRTARRQQLLSKGLWLAKNHPVATARRPVLGASKGPMAKSAKSLGGGGALASAVESKLQELAASLKMDQTSILSFDIERPPAPKAMAKALQAAAPPTPNAFHVIMGSSAPKAPGAVAKSAKSVGAAGNGAPRVKNIVALVAKEVDGKIVSVREVHGK